MHHTYLSFLNLTANDGEWLISNALKSGQNCAKKVGRMRRGELELGVDYWCDALSWASHSAVQCIIAVCRGQRSGASKPLHKHLTRYSLALYWLLTNNCMSPSARVGVTEVTILGYLERGALTAATQFARLQNLAKVCCAKWSAELQCCTVVTLWFGALW